MKAKRFTRKVDKDDKLDNVDNVTVIIEVSSLKEQSYEPNPDWKVNESNDVNEVDDGNKDLSR